MGEPNQDLETQAQIHIGRGRIHLERSHGSLHLSDLSFTYPLKLVAPKPTSKCQSVFILSYGGGLVGGDSIELSVDLESETAVALMTQGSTKIFKQRAGLPATKQTLSVNIAANATCLLIPDPVQPFADAAYVQKQAFLLHENATLVLLDWIVSGRPANGECWDFNSFISTNAIYSISTKPTIGSQSARRLLSRDCQIMHKPQTKTQMTSYNCLATLLFTGPKTEFGSTTILRSFKNLDRIRGHAASSKASTKDELIWTVTKHRQVTIVKVAAQSSEQVKEFLSQMIDLVDWRELFGREAFRALE